MTGSARSAAASANRGARRAANSRTARVLVQIGLVAFGLIHLIVGWIALQVAFSGGDGKQADQKGAIAQLASTPVGTPLLWIAGIGLFALTLWQAFAAVRGRSDLSGSQQLMKRVSSGGRAIVYAGLGIAAVQAATGSGSSAQSSDNQEEGLTAKLMSVTFGQILIALVGAVVVGIGVALMVKGVKEKFVEDFDSDPGTAGRRLGQIGYCAKGIALAIVGGLFVFAAIDHDPGKAGGLDDALSTVRSSVLGPYLLSLLALGFVAFGVFCFFWARSPKI